MKKISLILCVCFVLIFSGCGQTSLWSEDVILPTSNSVRLGAETSFVVLSEFFARQLAAFGLDFGDFKMTSKFLDRVVTPADSARLEISRDSEPFLTVFEARLSAEFTFEDLLAELQDLDLQPAIFGENSFYFINQDRATNLISLQNSALAFQFDSKNFNLVREFIFSLLILR